MAKTAERKRQEELEMIRLMVGLYCRGNHGKQSGLCPACAALYGYAAGRIARCPHMETKTFCSACKTHCYRPEMREQIRAVMRYAGPRMLFHHPVAAVKHLLVGRPAKSKKEGGRLV